MLHRTHFICLALLTISAAARAGEPWEVITDKEVAEITYEDAMLDDGVVVPLRKSLDHLDEDARKRFDEWMGKLDDWKPGQEDSDGQRVRNFISLVSVVDISQSEFEGEVAFGILERLKNALPKDKLIKICAWIALKPDEGKVVTSAADLGFETAQDENEVRERTAIYAKKLLGRLLGKLPPKDE